jgi:hypothetical protein
MSHPAALLPRATRLDAPECPGGAGLLPALRAEPPFAPAVRRGLLRCGLAAGAVAAVWDAVRRHPLSPEAVRTLLQRHW